MGCSAGLDLACTARQRHFSEGESDAAIGTGDEHDRSCSFMFRTSSCHRQQFSASCADVTDRGQPMGPNQAPPATAAKLMSP